MQQQLCIPWCLAFEHAQKMPCVCPCPADYLVTMNGLSPGFCLGNLSMFPFCEKERNDFILIMWQRKKEWEIFSRTSASQTKDLCINPEIWKFLTMNCWTTLNQNPRPDIAHSLTIVIVIPWSFGKYLVVSENISLSERQTVTQNEKGSTNIMIRIFRDNICMALVHYKLFFADFVRVYIDTRY